SMLILSIEIRAPDGNIKDASDAIWYTYVTVTTAGYGDRSPVSNAGRLVGVLIMTVGVGLFGTLTGFLANAFVTPAKDAADEGDSDAAALRSALPLRPARAGRRRGPLRRGGVAPRRARMIGEPSGAQRHRAASALGGRA